VDPLGQIHFKTIALIGTADPDQCADGRLSYLTAREIARIARGPGHATPDRMVLAGSFF
jgi:hypothetical protein